MDYQWLCAKPVKSAPAAQGPRNTMMCGLILLLILLICQAEAQGQHFYRKIKLYCICELTLHWAKQLLFAYQSSIQLHILGTQMSILTIHAKGKGVA